MAHGFLSYEDSRGVSGIEKALEDYLEKKFDQLKEHVTRERKVSDVKQDVRQASVNVLSGGSDPLQLKGSDQKQLAAAPVQRMLGGTALQRSLPAGAGAINPEVVGVPFY